MKTRILLIIVAPLLSFSVQAGFQSGNELLTDIGKGSGGDYMFAMGYVVGVFDAFSGLSHCVTANGVTQWQAILIAKKYLESHPEELHKEADVLLQEAFKAAFPCGTKP